MVDVVNLCVSAIVPKLASNPPLPVRVVTFVGVWNIVEVLPSELVQFSPSWDIAIPLRPPATN